MYEHENAISEFFLFFLIFKGECMYELIKKINFIS